jgi:predicted phage terminase large subunit-like protein
MDLDLSVYTNTELRRMLTLERRIQKHDAELSLFNFYRDYVWRAVEGKKPFLDNWHLHAIAEHLEAVSAGDITRLLINVPFRTSKSTLVSVAWPAWVWLKDPAYQWLCGSYAEKLAIRDSRNMRRVITSSAFVRDFGDRFGMSHDQNQKVRFENDRGGYRIAFGMTSGVMGDGGSALIIDDPMDRQAANSEAERETALTTYDQALVTRLNDPATSPIVIIMQRLHQNDLSGHVLKDQGVWTHLMLPMRFEASRRCVTSLGFRDPRTIEGELLWPERFPEKTVQSLESSLGIYGTSGQLAQRSSPAGGGILKADKFRLWPCTKVIPDLLWVGQSYDTSYTKDTANDPCACGVWGVFEYEKKNQVILLDSWSDHMEYSPMKKRMLDDWQAKYGGVSNDIMKPSRKADIIIIEEKGSGISVIQDIRLSNIPVFPYNPGKASKIQRAHMVAPLLENDICWVLESTKNRGKARNWAQPFLDQIENFPNAEHDDHVDTFTQLMLYLRDSGMLEIITSPHEDLDEIDYVKKREARVNPYS